ncbi:hypothetical protein D3C72_1982270 [compost metagenome]
MGVTDVVGGALNVAFKHGLSARAVNAQFLGAFGNGLVVFLQIVLGFARGVEAAAALALGDVLDGRAKADGDQGQSKNGQ